MKTQSVASLKKENGAVLVIGLMILLLATLVAVSAMTDANLQEKMAANSQNTNRAFQAAESAVDNQITSVVNGSTGMLTSSINQYLNNGTNWPTVSVALSDTDITSGITLRVLKERTLSIGDSMSSEEGTSKLVSYVYEMTAESELAGSKAAKTVVQGFEYN